MSITLLRYVGKVAIQPRHIVGILLVIAVVVLSFSSCHYSDKAAKAETRYLQQSGSASAHRAYSEGVRTVIQERHNAQDQATKVLQAVPEWSDERLPPDVADLLRHDSNASRAVP